MTIHTRISRSIAATVLGLAAVLGTAVPAAAGPPEINQGDCEAAGGTFDRVRGVKSCTTTAATRSYLQGPFYSSYYGGGVIAYEATWSEVMTWQDTTIRSQKGNGDVTSQTSSVLLSRDVVYKECQATLFGDSYPTSVLDCEFHNLYPVY